MNVAVCPTVTVWPAGCVMIEGATGGGFELATFPAHPALSIPTVRSNKDKTTPKRFMPVSSSLKVFPGTRHLGGEEQLTGEKL
jgi:hypothetical protein